MKKLLLIIIFLFAACNSDDIENAIEVAEGVDRKEGSIDRNQLGLNAFGNKTQFGSACEQYADAGNNLGIRYFRILINWNDGVQPSPGSSINYSFYDSLLNCVPAGVDALLVVNGLPSWMNDSANWQGGNPRTTFVNRWFKPVVDRYAGRGNVIGFQVWNEPNDAGNAENNILGFPADPVNFVEMQSLAYNLGKESTGKLIINAATTSIAQNFSATLDYNKALRNAGIEDVTDKFAIHYYGEQFERVILPSDGVADFLNSVSKPIWITESGRQSASDQLAYAETVWPFLNDKINNLERIYYYQYASASGSDSFGLRNLSADQGLSSLYVYLRDN